MARMARVVIPNYPHHITQRGNRRQKTFFIDDDYQAYISLLSNAKEQAGIDVCAYCLMPNHVHLVVVPEHKDSLVVFFREGDRQYTRRINFREGCAVVEGVLFDQFGDKQFAELISRAGSDGVIEEAEIELFNRVRALRNRIHASKHDQPFADLKIAMDLSVTYERLLKRVWVSST